MTTAPRRTLNDAVTQFWSFAAPAYDLPFLQQWVYRPAQNEVIAALNDSAARTVADIACGTGILADRIARELHPDEVYGVDMSDGMLAKARARSSEVQWRKGPAEHLPFEAFVSQDGLHMNDWSYACLAKALGMAIAEAMTRPTTAAGPRVAQ